MLHSLAQNVEDLALDEQFFRGQVGGVFVEMGALDGVTGSVSCSFERAFNWSGVLIEANPAMCELLQRHRPRATRLCTAVSSNGEPVRFQKGKFTTTFGDVSQMDPAFRHKFHSSHQPHIQVPSAPLGQLLRMVGVAYVDLFVLDVEGSELRVLRTMDWSLPVRVWCIEVDLAGGSNNGTLAELMTSKGYRQVQWDAGTDLQTSPASASALAVRAGIVHKLSHANQLWVWGGSWTPSKYAWRQYVHRDY